jgi:hypothetical protein
LLKEIDFALNVPDAGATDAPDAGRS